MKDSRPIVCVDLNGVLDHYTGVDRFVRTIGERMAAQELLADDPRFFNLHGTGVFIRQG